MSNISRIKFYLHTADTVRASQIKWVGMFNRPQTANGLIQERDP